MTFVIVAILLIAAAVGLVYFMGKKGKGKDLMKKPSQQSTSQVPQNQAPPQRPQNPAS